MRGSLDAAVAALAEIARGRDLVAASGNVEPEACQGTPNKCRKRKLRCCGNARLGHAKTSITMDVYAHTLPGMEDGAAEAGAALLTVASA